MLFIFNLQFSSAQKEDNIFIRKIFNIYLLGLEKISCVFTTTFSTNISSNLSYRSATGKVSQLKKFFRTKKKISNLMLCRYLLLKRKLTSNKIGTKLLIP
jgi:hypothetical protein